MANEWVENLVEIFPAAFGSAQTPDFLVFDGELVVIGDFFPTSDRLLRIYHNLLFSVNGDNLGVTVWLQGTKKLTHRVPMIYKNCLLIF